MTAGKSEAAESFFVLLRHGGGRLQPQDLPVEMLYEAILLAAHPAAANAAKTAEALSRRYGRASELLNEDYEILAAIKGVGEEGATLIKLAAAFHRRSAAEERRPALDPEKNSCRLAAIERRLRAEFGCEKGEVTRAVFVDGGGCLISDSVLCRGGFAFGMLPVGELTREAQRLGARGVVIAHNHPGVGELALRSSPEDIRLTRQLAERLDEVGVTLVEHLIFDAGGDCYPLLRSMMLPAAERAGGLKTPGKTPVRKK